MSLFDHTTKKSPPQSLQFLFLIPFFTSNQQKFLFLFFVSVLSSIHPSFKTCIHSLGCIWILCYVWIKNKKNLKKNARKNGAKEGEKKKKQNRTKMGKMIFWKSYRLLFEQLPIISYRYITAYYYHYCCCLQSLCY